MLFRVYIKHINIIFEEVIFDKFSLPAPINEIRIKTLKNFLYVFDYIEAS